MPHADKDVLVVPELRIKAVDSAGAVRDLQVAHVLVALQHRRAARVTVAVAQTLQLEVFRGRRSCGLEHKSDAKELVLEALARYDLLQAHVVTELTREHLALVVDALALLLVADGVTVAEAVFGDFLGGRQGRASKRL